MVSPYTHWATVVGTYLTGDDATLDDVAERLEAAAHAQPGGKFGKEEAVYLPQAPFPPTLWRTSCGRCRFWEEGEPGEPATCHIVGRTGDRFGGEAIHYRGWCAYWMPPAGEPAFSWVSERLDPTGKESVRGKYDPQVATDETRRRRRAKARPEADGGPNVVPDEEDGDDGV